jgi:outer membrane usher protein
MSTADDLRDLRDALDCIAHGALPRWGNPTTKSGEEVEHRGEALVQRSLPIGQGVGYYLRANTDRLLAGGVSYAGPYGRYSLEGSDAAGTTALRASATGAVAWVGSDFIASQSIEPGFAIVRVADLGDVRILQENHDVGRTRGGKLALTQIPALNPIKITVDPVTVPMEVSLEEVAREVVLLPRTGVPWATEKELSTALFRFPDGRYGTRSSLLVTAEARTPERWHLSLEEKSWDPDRMGETHQESLEWAAEN